MGEFFRGWNRKSGVVTLLVAVVLMGLWLRSSFLKDFLTVSVGGDRFLSMASFPESLVLAIIRTSDPNIAAQAPAWGTETVKVDDKSPWDDSETQWIWRFRPFGYCEVSRHDQDFDVGMFFFPLWSIVIPLTALSTYLLLSKPRKTTQKKIIEPTAIEGA